MPNNQMDMNECHRTLFQMSDGLGFANSLFALLRLSSGNRQSSGRYSAWMLVLTNKITSKSYVTTEGVMMFAQDLIERILLPVQSSLIEPKCFDSGCKPEPA